MTTLGMLIETHGYWLLAQQADRVHRLIDRHHEAMIVPCVLLMDCGWPGRC